MPAVAVAAAASYVYNDFGDLDKDPDLARLVIDTKELPYPRRCKTGRKSDPLSESRSSDVYVPRDEAFSEIKNLSFSFKTMYSVLHAVIPSLETTIIDKELGFPYFTTIDSLFNEGVNLPQLESKGFLGNVLPRLLKVIKDTQNNILLFETPEMMDKDKFGWMRDEEFCRQTLASLNPLSIRLVMPSYGLAEDTSRTRGTMGGQDVSPNELYSQSAIYIVAAHALKPNYSVHNFCLYPI